MAIDQQVRQGGEDPTTEYLSQGERPDITFDPTQGQGTAAWQLSVKHSMENNAKERRN